MARGVKYTQEFKESAIQLALNSEETICKIARDLDINEKTLYGWVRDYRKKHNIMSSEKRTKK
jgi:transposase